MSEYLIFLLFFPILYAEIHYRFNFFLSLLYKSEPEIIADIPSRIKCGDSLPVLIVIKDAHRFPVDIVRVIVHNNQKEIFNETINKNINVLFKEIILRLDTSSLPPGKNLLNIQIQYGIRGKNKNCFNDNYQAGSHNALPVYIAKEDLPRIDNCFYGDMHYHTNYTSDQVEFGASIQSTGALAKTMNLDFFCATDHSYDLDDQPDNYLLPDKNLKKWSNLRQEIEEFNEGHNDFLIIQGEEISLRNSSGKNIHCLIYNSKQFFPGSGDSGEKWFQTRSEFSIEELLAAIGDKTLVFAAHPDEVPPFLQRFFLDRGSWDKKDCSHKRLDGLQIINGDIPESINKNKQFWIDLLLSGEKLIGIAGNDAHGNFSRYRQISVPPFTMKEHYYHLFGKWRTGIYPDTPYVTLENCLTAIKNGNCFMTNGPALQFMALDSRGWKPMGSKCDHIQRLKMEILSTDEFNTIEKISIYCGFTGRKQENHIVEQTIETEHFHYKQEFDIVMPKDTGYLRAEAYTRSGYQALSNPIWF